MKALVYFLFFGILWCQAESEGQLCFESGCFFNGNLYQNGETINDACFNMVCNGGTWNYEGINQECAKCRICDDPHIKTFDELVLTYDWHGVCNYSLSQPFCNGLNCSYSPDYGVYGDFVTCSYDDKVSCVDITTYKVDPHTAIHLQHNLLPRMEINNNFGDTQIQPQVPTDCNTGDRYPIIAWSPNFVVDNQETFWGCSFILGNNYALIVCPTCLFIFTLPTQKDKINGLCGYYNGVATKDYVKRDDCNLDVFPISDFATSWMTLQQKDDNTCCPLTEKLRTNALIQVLTTCIPKKYYSSCETAVRKGFERCPSVDGREFREIVGDCVTDCCGDPNNANRWIENARNVTYLHCDVINHTTRKFKDY